MYQYAKLFVVGQGIRAYRNLYTVDCPPIGLKASDTSTSDEMTKLCVRKSLSLVLPV